MKLLGPWLLRCTSHSSCSGSLPSETHLRYRRTVGALRCPPFTVCSAAQTKSLASLQSHATKTRGHHSSEPGHQTTSAKPQIPPPLWAALGCLREKGVTQYYVTRFDHLREKGKHKDSFVSALPGAPGSSLL